VLSSAWQLAMPITYIINHQKGLIRETWKGKIGGVDLAAYWLHYLADPEVLAIRRTVVDLRKANIDFSGLDFDALIRTIVLPVLGERTWTTAIVIRDPIQFGVSRHYQIFAERYSKDSIFRNVADAERWILSAETTGVA
jgi:hypothetical protein